MMTSCKYYSTFRDHRIYRAIEALDGCGTVILNATRAEANRAYRIGYELQQDIRVRFLTPTIIRIHVYP